MPQASGNIEFFDNGEQVRRNPNGFPDDSSVRGTDPVFRFGDANKKTCRTDQQSTKCLADEQAGSEKIIVKQEG